MKSLFVLLAAGTLLGAAPALAQSYPPDPAYDAPPNDRPLPGEAYGAPGQGYGVPPAQAYGVPPGQAYGVPPGQGDEPLDGEDGQLPPGLHYGPDPAFGGQSVPRAYGGEGTLYGRPGYPAYRNGRPEDYRRLPEPRYGRDGDPRRRDYGSDAGPEGPRRAQGEERMRRDQAPKTQRRQHPSADEDRSGN